MEVHSPQGEHKPEMWEELTFQSVIPPGAWEPMDPLSHPTGEQIYSLYYGINQTRSTALSGLPCSWVQELTRDHPSQIYLGHLGFHHEVSPLRKPPSVLQTGTAGQHTVIPHSCTLTPPTK